jgi:lysophospholipase L1-like esterase
MLGFFGAASCGSSPVAPPPVPTLVVTCPANIVAQSPDGKGVSLTFETPQTAGGTPPITTTCSAESGATFDVGTSVVSCTARDTAGRTAVCSFAVNIQAPPRLIGARFVAFGDSLTEGVLSPPVSSSSISLYALAPELIPLIPSPPHSYPYMLERQLAERYRLQTPVVLNEGIAGERAAEGGVQRFRGVLLQHRPDVVLLMEGTNDLLGLGSGAIVALEALRLMVREAKSQAARVGLATIPPQRAGGLRHRDAVAALIPSFNDQIRAMARSEEVTLIDVYDAMKDNLSLIGVDDLHPTEAGFRVIAEAFFESIKAAFEEKPSTSALRRQVQ